MNCVTEIEVEKTAAPQATELRLPGGLLGFEQTKEYLLIANPDEEPFLWLQVKDDATLAFVVIDPFLVAPDYRPDIPQADVESIGLKNVGDALLLNIVTVHGQASRLRTSRVCPADSSQAFCLALPPQPGFS